MRLAAALCASALALAPSFALSRASDTTQFTWSGLYLGAHGGYGLGSSEWDLSNGSTHSLDVEGGFIGLQAGYNLQLMRNLVTGIEISTAASEIHDKGKCSSSGFTCNLGIKSISDVSARLGVSYGASLLYGKAGLAYATTQHDYDDGTTYHKETGDAKGWLIGAGLEGQFSPNVTGRVEYDYYDFGSEDARYGATRIDDELSFSVIKGGFNIKFN